MVGLAQASFITSPLGRALFSSQPSSQAQLLGTVSGVSSRPLEFSVLTSVCKPKQVLSMCALSCPTAEVFPNAQDDKMQGSQVKPPPPVLSAGSLSFSEHSRACVGSWAGRLQGFQHQQVTQLHLLTVFANSHEMRNCREAGFSRQGLVWHRGWSDRP